MSSSDKLCINLHTVYSTCFAAKIRQFLHYSLDVTAEMSSMCD